MPSSLVIRICGMKSRCGRGAFQKIGSVGTAERKMVGTTGFEPATSRTPSVRATRLRYVPTACTVCSVSLAFEKGQDGEKFFVQIEEKFALSLGGSFAA